MPATGTVPLAGIPAKGTVPVAGRSPKGEFVLVLEGRL